MTSAEPAAEPGFVSFGMLRADGPETADALVGLLTGETTRWVRHTPGFVSSRVHVGTDGTTVVNRGEWTDEETYRTSFEEHPEGGLLRSLGTRRGVLAATVFRGSPAAPRLEGPAAHARPGVAVVATRHLGDRAAADAVLEMLADSGAWKRHHPGFVSATPCVDRNGTTLVNYPTWTDETAYREWMADPRISEGQEKLARLEVAPPEYVLCRVAAQIDAA
ncbi:antibiotic biosynthesis monooxygenase [Streptomyces sp. MUM 203J]|uniref:antibiotic biosynthesis monooxygenase n=1 Tax=Streptomyces sp. MUM 203J TaxID=2791990 RepID=UPI001F043F0D|nr:antibiotic biosynthesis monooxygenase [Streptomyces sp. MUM 203J]MCH0542322.1 antibiotic biosynthesis monooxygenase [Streptomyces sp. MUM 203J]